MSTRRMHEVGQLKKALTFGWGLDPNHLRDQGRGLLITACLAIASLAFSSLFFQNGSEAKSFILIVIGLPMLGACVYSMRQFFLAARIEREPEATVVGLCVQMVNHTRYSIFFELKEDENASSWYYISTDRASQLEVGKKVALTVAPSNGWVKRIEDG